MENTKKLLLTLVVLGSLANVSAMQDGERAKTVFSSPTTTRENSARHPFSPPSTVARSRGLRYISREELLQGLFDKLVTECAQLEAQGLNPNESILVQSLRAQMGAIVMANQSPMRSLTGPRVPQFQSPVSPTHLHWSRRSEGRRKPAFRSLLAEFEVLAKKEEDSKRKS